MLATYSTWAGCGATCSPGSGNTHQGQLFGYLGASSSAVSALQSAMNRFSVVLKLSKLKVDGFMGPKTLERFKQLAASILVAELFFYAFQRGTEAGPGVIDAATLTKDASFFATIITEKANQLHLTGTSADPKPTPTETHVNDAAMAAAGVPRDRLPAWFKVGAVVVVVGGVAAVMWGVHS